MSVGGSIGVAVAGSEGRRDVDTLAAQADAQMYAAKAARNVKVGGFDAGADSTALRARSVA